MVQVLILEWPWPAVLSFLMTFVVGLATGLLLVGRRGRNRRDLGLPQYCPPDGLGEDAPKPAKTLGDYPVPDPPAPLLGFDQSRVHEDLEVVRDGRLRPTERLH